MNKRRLFAFFTDFKTVAGAVSAVVSVVISYLK